MILQIPIQKHNCRTNLPSEIYQLEMESILDSWKRLWHQQLRRWWQQRVTVSDVEVTCTIWRYSNSWLVRHDGNWIMYNKGSLYISSLTSKNTVNKPLGRRSFNVSAPRIWNGLPEDVASAPSYQHTRVVWKLTFSNSHIRMLLYIRHPSGPCGDTGHLGHCKNNWTELN